MEYKVIKHASIKIKSNDKIIYFDPFEIKDELADYIFVTHDHYDHYDENTIKELLKENTKIIIPKLLEETVSKYTNNFIVVEPNNNYVIDDIKVEVIPSYNINKQFHPKEKDYVGYNIEIENTKLYVMGDTDRTSEANEVKTDICFVPIGGTYTMNVDEAIEYINELKPKIVVPIHYGSIIGNNDLGKQLKDNVKIETKLFI